MPHFILHMFLPFSHCHSVPHPPLSGFTCGPKDGKKEEEGSLPWPSRNDYMPRLDSQLQYVPNGYLHYHPPQVPHTMASKHPSSLNSSDREKDCQEIHDSCGRLNKLGHGLAHRSRSQLQQVRETYKAMYGEDLVDCIQRAEGVYSKNEICMVLSLWLCEPHERDAIVAKDAMAQGDTEYRSLVEIYVGRKSSQLLLIQQAYRATFKKHLDQEISTLEPPTSTQRMLVALATSHRSLHVDVNQHVAKCDAKRLYESGEGKAGSAPIDESTVLEILSKRSIQQLKLTFSTYKRIYGHDYTKSLKKGTSREFEDSLRAFVKCMYTPAKYYAKMLHSRIKGTTMDKSALGRIIVSRAEVDMKEIQDVYQKKYGMKLYDAICESIAEGDYRDFLLALVTRPPPSSSTS